MNNLIFEDYFYHPNNIKKIDNYSQLFRNLALYSWLKKVETDPVTSIPNLDDSATLQILESKFKRNNLNQVLSSECIQKILLESLSSPNFNPLADNNKVSESLIELLGEDYLLHSAYSFYLEILEIYMFFLDVTIQSSAIFLENQKDLILKISKKTSQQYEIEDSSIYENEISKSIIILSEFCIKNNILFTQNIKNDFINTFINPDNYVKYMHHLTQISLNLLEIPEDDINNDNLLAWNIREDLRIIAESLEQHGHYESPQQVSYHGVKNERFNFIKNKNIKASYKKDIFNYLSKVNFI